MRVNGKKLFLIGFAVILLVGIPLSIYLLQQQQEVRSRAEKSTNLAFSPDSTQAAPIQKNVGDSIPLDVTVDPGKNLVSFVKLEIQYDPDVLATASANAFQANTIAFPSTLEGPVYTKGKIAVTLSVGPDPTKAIQQKVKAATITFTALKATPPGTPTVVTYSTSTQVLSIGSGDQASENVLSSASPATIAIGGEAPSPTGEISPTEGPTPTISLEPTISEAPTASPTEVLSPSPTEAISGGANSSPTCSNLTIDRAAEGNAPYSVTFTANGNDPDGTISKVTFNFGDGQQSDVTDSGGIGTASINVQASHTFNNPGTYQASAILTDNNSGISTPDDACKQTITVTRGSGTGGGNGGGATGAATIAPTGSTETAIGIGLAVMMLIVGGGLLFLVL